MRRAISVFAFLCSFATFLVLFGAGIFLALVESTGERSAGTLIALVALVAMAAALILILAPARVFAGARGVMVATAAAAVGSAPVFGLGGAAIVFAGLPAGSRLPLIDWSVLGAGIALALGGLAVLALGWLRLREARRASAQALPDAQIEQIRSAQRQLRLAMLEAPDPDDRYREDDEVRVTPVDLPSIARFRAK